MKIVKTLMILVGMVLLSASAMAQDTKIGIINLEQALFTSEAARGVQQEIEAEFSTDVERAQSIQQELVELPKELQDVLDEPPPPNTWIPQTTALALIVSIVEARRLTASAESLWIRDAATHLFASPMYRILMQAASPRMVFKTAHLRWGAFFRGTELSSTVEDRVAELTLSGPPGLFNRDLAEIFEDVIFAAVHYTREHSPSTDLTLLGQAPNGAVYYRGQW